MNQQNEIAQLKRQMAQMVEQNKALMTATNNQSRFGQNIGRIAKKMFGNVTGDGGTTAVGLIAAAAIIGSSWPNVDTNSITLAAGFASQGAFSNSGRSLSNSEFEEYG